MVRKASKNPQKLLRILVPGVVVLSFVPDFFQFDDGGAVGVATLMVMHIALAAIAVPVYRRVMPLTAS